MTRRNKKNGAKGFPPVPANLTRSAGSAKGAGGASRGRSGLQVAAAYGQQVRNQGPRFIANGRSLTISHREYVTRVMGAVGFSVSDPFSLNPGRYQPFPWLSDIARKFEAYTFHSLRFVYIPSCPTNSKGSVSMVYDYDAADAAPASVQEMLQSQGATRGPCWQELCAAADIDYMSIGGKRRFTRHAAVPAGKDIKTYDCGNFFLAVDGFDNGNTYGDLFVEYTVELLVPQPSPDFELEESVVVSAGAASVSKTTPFGAIGTQTLTGLLDVLAGSDMLWFKQPGEYKIDYALTGTGLNTAAPDVSSSTAATKVGGITASGDGLGARGFIQADVKNVNEAISLKFPTVTTLTNLAARISPYAFSLF